MKRAKSQTPATARSYSPPLMSGLAQALAAAQEQQVLEFLAEQPLHTVTMAGFIRDNGLVSPLNRGTFYSYRGVDGKLEGVALIGHATLINARTDQALRAFASLAQSCRRTHMLLGQREQINSFWRYYSTNGQQMRLACSESLFELRWPVAIQPDVPGLRRAVESELELVMPVHAQMAFDESGVDPRVVDPKGFAERCLRRIRQGRTWVLVQNNQLVFKADIVSDANDIIYLEGIWVSETHRGNGFGVRCLTQLSRQLLRRANSICLLANEANRSAQTLYRKSGYRLRGTYDTIFLQPSQERASLVS